MWDRYSSRLISPKNPNSRFRKGDCKTSSATGIRMHRANPAALCQMRLARMVENHPSDDRARAENSPWLVSATRANSAHFRFMGRSSATTGPK